MPSKMTSTVVSLHKTALNMTCHIRSVQDATASAERAAAARELEVAERAAELDRRAEELSSREVLYYIVLCFASIALATMQVGQAAHARC